MRSQLESATVVDKNGRTTTVYRKPESAPKTSTSFPKISNHDQDSLRPDSKQHNKKHTGILRYNASPELCAVFDISRRSAREPKFTMLHVSEVEAYRMFSIMSLPNAVLLMDRGIKTEEEAISFFKENDLEHLIQDNRTLMYGALDRKIPLDKFAMFYNSKHTADVDVDRFLDAAEVYTYKAVQYGNLSSLPELVIAGEISYADLKEVTFSVLTRCGDATIDALKEIQRGNSRYTSKELGLSLKRGSNEGLSDTEIIRTIDSVGHSTFYSARDHKKAAALGRIGAEKYPYDRFKRQDLISYMNALEVFKVKLGVDDIVTLFESGASANRVVEEARSGATVNQIIAVHAKKVHSSVSSGWL